MDINQLKALFIEEATEVIEKLDIDIINFEENPQKTELLDELYRGVHTLKGSANAFEFSKLGEFVHHFEDALSYCRNIYNNSEKTITAIQIDVFLEAVDIIKEVLQIEITGSDGLPQNYLTCLEHIKKITQKNNNQNEVNTNEIDESINKDINKKEIIKESDLGSEFDNIDNSAEAILSNNDLQKIKLQLHEQEFLYCIKLLLHKDIYVRGFDHLLFFKLLSSAGNILQSYWDMSNIPILEELEDHSSYIHSITIYYISKLSHDEVLEFFEYLEDAEYQITSLSTEQNLSQETITDKTIVDKNIVDKNIPQKGSPFELSQHNPTNKINNSRKKKSKFKNIKLENHSYIKVNTLKLDELFDSIAELVIAQNFISEADDIKKINNESVERSLAVLSKVTRRIQNGVMSLRMIPIKDTFEKMKRVTRDACKKVSKNVKLIIEGSDTEIDKTMIDALSDPLIHVIRNAIDHGIENDLQKRVKNGKNAQGQVTLKAYHRAGNVAIEISDDGSGIDKEKVLNKAIEKGLINTEDQLSDSQIYSLIMQAGFSTADQISDVSGRGVGLDVVRNAIEKLSGKVEIHSKIGEGTTFIILLPLTLAIIDGMTIRSESDTFIIPTLNIIESFIPQKHIVHTYKKEGEFVDLRGDMLPVVRLNHVLEIAQTTPNIWESTLICIENDKGKFALLVDDIIGSQQVVIKSLDPVLAKVKELAGSAILGNGEVSLILNTEELY